MWKMKYIWQRRLKNLSEEQFDFLSCSLSHGNMPFYSILAQHWKSKLYVPWANSENLLAWVVWANNQFSFSKRRKAYGVSNLILIISTRGISVQIKCAIWRTILSAFLILSFNDEAKNQELLPTTLTIKIQSQWDNNLMGLYIICSFICTTNWRS